MDGKRRNALIAGLGLAAAPALPRAQASAAPAAAPRIVAEEYWASKQGVKLWVYRKRLAEGAPRAQLFLVHGSSYSGKTMYDLQVPGRTDYSMMDHFAHRGYDVWTMDHEGYGHSDRTDGNSDVQSGVDDLAAAMAVVEKAVGTARLAFFGQSSGALRAARSAPDDCPKNASRGVVPAFSTTAMAAFRSSTPD